MEITGKVHCLFEQSGTFKNEFIKLGYESYDYDIQNNFGQTDNICNLFDEIEKGYNGENPEHWNWVRSVAVPRLQAMGLKVTILHSDLDMVSIFHKVRGSQSKYTGKINGFFIGGLCQGNSLLKMRPLDRYKREMNKLYNVVYYVGIAKDEKKRLARHDGINQVSLLEKYDSF